MKQKLVALLKRVTRKRVIYAASGAVLVPIALLIGFTAFNQGWSRFFSVPIVKERQSEALDEETITHSIQQDSFAPGLLSSEDLTASVATPGVVTGWPSPSEAHSTTGPTPPPGIDRGMITMQAAAKILEVPAYLWHHGCGPTAVGMVLGYWDSVGYDELVTGSALTQTAAVNSMIASTEHYNDYSLPIDAPPGPILPDKSEAPAGDEHANNSVADFMQTSQSVHGLYYGWSYFNEIGDSLSNYVAYTGTGYAVTTSSSTMADTFTWAAYKAEIDAGRPVVLLVDTDGDSATDHFVTAIGYSEVSGSQMYGVRDTWDTNVHWFNFAQMAPGVSWGIYGATFFNLAGSIQGRILDSSGTAITGVTVTLNNGATATTDNTGNYTISGLAPGTYTITPSKTGYSFTPATRTATLPPNAMAQDFTGSTCTEAIVNNGFESTTGWVLPITVYPAGYDATVTLDVTAEYSIEEVHSGSRSLRTGILDPAKNVYSYSSGWQQVTIPATVKSATLSFWLFPKSVGPLEGSGGDVQLVLILDQNKKEKERLVMLRSDERVWKFYQFDLKKYAGQTIWVYFGTYNNGYNSNMALYVDDVSLLVCSQ